MKTRQFTHLISVMLLLLWGGVMLYFYASGRLAKGEYVSKNGWFTTMVVVGGIGCVVVGLFNLATMGAKEADCCDHDHGHDHDHDGHDHHDHSHKAGECCGHSHGDAHEHKHDATCGHDHAHEHTHDHASCGHDHSHDHVSRGHDHHDEEDHGHAGHAHGILEESGFIGRLVAIIILAVPITYASIKSPDGYKSVSTMANRGVYDQSYQKDAKSSKFDLKKSDTTPQQTPPAPAVVTPTVAASSPQSPPAGMASPSADAPPATVANAAPSGASQSKSYGTFTLKDLEAQVPKSKEGNFQLEVPEIYYTAGDKEVQGVITGQSIETIAQVIPEKVNNAKGNRVRIFRMLIQCCAADARPYSVPVDFGKEAPKFKEMSWVKVVGKMNYVKEGDQIVPIIEATSMTEAPEPDSKMVY